MVNYGLYSPYDFVTSQAIKLVQFCHYFSIPSATIFTFLLPYHSGWSGGH